MNERPGYLEPIYSQNGWLDLVLRSDLDDTTKLVAVVVSRTAQYNRTQQLMLTNVSDYSIGRIIQKNKYEVRDHIELLFDNGWLHDTGSRRGARKVFALVFSLIPLGEIRT